MPTPSIVGLLLALLISPVVSAAEKSDSKWQLPDQKAQPAATLTPEEAAAGWKLLFDGHSLDGWKPAGSDSSFSASNGMIIGSGDAAHLFYVGPVEQHDFRDFELEMEVMMSRNTNSGVFFHTKFENSSGVSKGYEVQISNGRDPSRTGGLYGIQDQPDQLTKEGEWFTLRVKVQGKRVVTWVNDQVACDFTEEEKVRRPAKYEGRRLSRGTFALQIRSGKVMFRGIKVRPTS